MGAGMASDVTGVLGAREFKRPAYAGNAIETVEVSGNVLVASVRQTAFAAASPAGSAGAVETVAVTAVEALGTLCDPGAGAATLRELEASSTPSIAVAAQNAAKHCASR